MRMRARIAQWAMYYVVAWAILVPFVLLARPWLSPEAFDWGVWAVYVFSLPGLIYLAYTNVVFAAWWLVSVVWRGRRSPRRMAVVGVALVGVVVLLVWVAPAVDGGHGQFVSVVLLLAAVELAYLTKRDILSRWRPNRRPRQPRDHERG